MNIYQKLKHLIKYPLTSKQLSNRLLYEFVTPNEQLPYRPVWLLLYLTDACNLRCVMCPHHTPSNANDFKYKKKLTFNMKSDVLNEILYRFPESITVFLAGVGEPTLHPNFVDIIEHLASQNKIIDLTTNGYYISDKISHILATTKMVREVSISLNGCSNQEHKQITGSDKFELIIANIQRLVKIRKTTGIPDIISVSQICTTNNVSLWPKYVELAADLGVDRLYLHNVINMSIQGEYTFEPLKTKLSLKTVIYNLPNHIGKTIVYKPTLIRELQGLPKCKWFFKNLVFDAEGNLGSCGRVMNPQPEYGNIGTSEDLWNNDYMKSLRETFLDNSGSMLIDVCKICVENF